MSLTRGLKAPRCPREFTKEWARRILVEHMQKTDPGWLLGSVLKVVDVTARENPHPGMLSDSYVVDVTYRQSQDEVELSMESWFVKVPQSDATTVVDEVEALMYHRVFPSLQEFVDCETDSNEIQMPVALVFHCAFSRSSRENNHLVMENLRDQGYKPLRPETCGLVFMRAAMDSLAAVHASSYAYREALGGKGRFLRRFPLIREEALPKLTTIKDAADQLMAPYLAFMSRVQPDIAPQMAFLTKFRKFLLPVFAEISNDKELQPLKIMVHGDSKIDNFMFRKQQQRQTGGRPCQTEDDCSYSALIVDWQGVSYDYLSGDLLWTLYGFLKNLPDKNATVDGFVDYSICCYHRELLRLLKELKVDPETLNLPTDEYDIVRLTKKGFVHNFLKVAVITPLLTIKNPDMLLKWYDDDRSGSSEGASNALPEDAEIFKTGSTFVNFVHLYIVIATEIGVFHDLGPMCITLMKDVMFGGSDILDKLLEAGEVETELDEPIEDIANDGETNDGGAFSKVQEEPVLEPGERHPIAESIGPKTQPDDRIDVNKRYDAGDEDVARAAGVNGVRSDDDGTETVSAVIRVKQIEESASLTIPPGVTKSTPNQRSAACCDDDDAGTGSPEGETQKILCCNSPPQGNTAVGKNLQTASSRKSDPLPPSSLPSPSVPPPVLKSRRKTAGKRRTKSKVVGTNQVQAKAMEDKINGLKENMRKTMDSVLDIQKLMADVRPLAKAQTSGNGSSEDELTEAVEGTSVQPNVTDTSIRELSKSVSEFLQVCLQELHDI